MSSAPQKLKQLMTATKDLLIEIGTEELPPKALPELSDAFTRAVVAGLEAAALECGQAHSFAAPRRLAVLVSAVPEAQPDRDVERKGPSLKAAYDADGNPTRAAEGFARSCGVAVAELEQQETDKGTWLVYRTTERGQPVSQLVPLMVEQALASLPIPKRMRWGDCDEEFVRPVHWAVIMHGETVIETPVLGVVSSGRTRGHRFHANRDIELQQAGDYATRLKNDGCVIADFDERRRLIHDQVINAAGQHGGVAMVDDELLTEVTALNEWPVAVVGEFESDYLSVPAEALIKTMQDNQKYFPVVDGDGKLMNVFITISNIDSTSPDTVKAGNERVIRPRLADAKFFWEQDRKQPLESHAEALNQVVFQEKLGTLGDKTRRVTMLAQIIAEQLGANVEFAKRAAALSKCDLMTAMVGEFASLQGIMGKRYAEVGGEAEEVALALDEQYMPRGGSDRTPATATGQILAISDKLDTLVGIFAIGQKPTGEKDPYALRRAALGILRTIIERELDLDLRALLAESARLFPDDVDAVAAVDAVFEFMLERLRAYYADRNIPVDVFDAVYALRPSRPLDFSKRIQAVSAFRLLPEAESLSAANKRVGNILKKTEADTAAVVNAGLFEVQEEENLYNELEALKRKTEPQFEAGDYETALCELSVLRKPIDDFFDNVMVMTDSDRIRNNRIALLNKMHRLFMRAADLSRLH